MSSRDPRAKQDLNRSYYLRHRSRLLDNKRLRLYGITREAYDLLFAEQGGRCALCRKVATESLCVDHDHSTGVVRGLLCRTCNRWLGWFENDERRAFLLRYLERGKA